MKLEKLRVVAFAVCVSGFTPLNSFIYYPALSDVLVVLQIALSKIELRRNSYMVVSGRTLLRFRNVANQIGRQPVYLLIPLLYVLTNFGLALWTSYSSLKIGAILHPWFQAIPLRTSSFNSKFCFMVYEPF